MATNKIERIDREIEKTREKITEYQNKLKGLEAQKTEAENLQIVQLVRSMRLSPAELTIRMPVSLISSRSASSCRRCVSFAAGVSNRNWSTDIW